MARKIVSTTRSGPRVHDVGPASPRIEPATVAAALGAEDERGEAMSKGSPLTLLQLRAELAGRLQSSGGRPALEGVTRRVKIPLTDRQWREIEELAASLSDQDISPTAGQVASVLLSLSLSRARGEAQILRRELAAQIGVGDSGL